MNTPASPSPKTVRAIAHCVVQNQGRHSKYTIDLAFALLAAQERVKELEYQLEVKQEREACDARMRML